MVLNCCELWSRLVLPLEKLKDQFRVNYKFFAPDITHTLNRRKAANNTLVPLMRFFFLIKLTKVFIPEFFYSYKLSYYALVTCFKPQVHRITVCFLVPGIKFLVESGG